MARRRSATPARELPPIPVEVLELCNEDGWYRFGGFSHDPDRFAEQHRQWRLYCDGKRAWKLAYQLSGAEAGSPTDAWKQAVQAAKLDAGPIIGAAGTPL